MQLQTISDIYEANSQIRRKLCETVGGLSPEQLNALPEGEKWSISDIVEHVSIVNGGMFRICSKLLSKAEADGKMSDGQIDLSSFMEKTAGAAEMKLEAPEMVRPKGGQALDASLAALDEGEKSFQTLVPAFDKYDGNAAKFPHPYFGDLSAIEWLVLAGGHEARHLRQIRRILEKIG